jgi:hypothetical protein
MGGDGVRFITYCTNIHSGESWDDIFTALRQHIPLIKSTVSPNHPFPIGLRLSSRAATELTSQKNRLFTAWLHEQECFIPTINGFPFGSFHGERVKERVYLPDWRSSERAEYTIRLANLLAEWLPEGVTGSISTVPVGFKNVVGISDYPEIRTQIQLVLMHLRRIFDETGKRIILALEPEPGCLLETTEEFGRFYETMAFDENLPTHFGICYDCCHQAVEFEDPAESLRRLATAGVPIAKVQVSSGIQVDGGFAAALERFVESCYLHQTVVQRQGGELVRYIDLPEALTCHERRDGDEWRCHFHVPIFFSGETALDFPPPFQGEGRGGDGVGCAVSENAQRLNLPHPHPNLPLEGEGTKSEGTNGNFTTTQKFLTEILPFLPKNILLEVETYTWDVLPVELRCGSVTDSIIREIEWLKEHADA